MNRTLQAALGLSLVALCSPALAQDPLSVRISPNAHDIGAAGTDTRDFRAAALKSDALSIESSRIALQRSRDPRVRDYAHRILVERKATTEALLPPNTSLTAGGTVVPDRTGIETRLDNPVGVILAPVTISANIASTIVGGVLGGVGVIDNSPTEPGRRVAIGPEGQARIERLKSAPSGKAFDRAYIAQQARSDARTLAVYGSYAQNGDDAQGRKFAYQALPYIASEHAQSARLAVGGRSY